MIILQVLKIITVAISIHFFNDHLRRPRQYRNFNREILHQEFKSFADSVAQKADSLFTYKPIGQ